MSKKQQKNSSQRKISTVDPTSVQLVKIKIFASVQNIKVKKSLFLFLNKPDINERFVDACENGDINTVNNIIQNIKDFNIEVTDNLGRTALRLAVENEQLEVNCFNI